MGCPMENSQQLITFQYFNILLTFYFYLGHQFVAVIEQKKLKIKDIYIDNQSKIAVKKQ